MKKYVWLYVMLMLGLTACGSAPEKEHAPAEDHQHDNKKEDQDNDKMNNTLMD